MYFEVEGRSEPDAQTILLSSGLGGSGAYWTPQMEMLQTHFRVVTYDHRGTGRTGGEVPQDGGISAMADDVLEIANELKLQKFHFMGHALGGLIGLDIALRQPDLIDRLVLINAWSKADAHSGRCFDTRISLLENSGVEAFVKAQPLFLYPAVWMSDNAERLAKDDAHGVVHFQGRDNVLRRIAALRAFDVDGRLGEINNRTLVIAAKDDLLVPYTRSLRLAEGLPNAQLFVFDEGAHAVNITDVAGFNTELEKFLLSPASI
ncbi:pyrimidine utilization protein D [Agrobacterium rubi]|uniref:Putative carbamate hydrolase RutD n=1 Tax=Agrobacterium rubi TaxID=28099 RepID=A0AAE7USN6_9HYPH|nr:pyrimidine utilization protein D [Agrobacterium rubi]MCL6652781.1 pyrimidine utilization protein D [Agrobacterium rubi]NTE88519.1 pyrimidine utilization protein D [Agrobacterium rubi]NTF04347.1 pyrimidine utilization protein D [Agrobacterium rubi]NTF09880.1 pyrimidine utilization protein D [Agrobacterium rubi]NTF21943.1 pyrimidine utilization protein D [Agrobacterium rubi]